MPPLLSLPVVAADAARPCWFATLPTGETLAVLSRLPLCARLTCAEVCRGWCAALKERTAWARLQMDPWCRDAQLRAACALARGAVQQLDVSSCTEISTKALLDVVAANAGALYELRGVGCSYIDWSTMGCTWLENDTTCAVVEKLLTAAPLLRVLDVSVQCTAEEAHRLLRNEAPFGPVCAREILFNLCDPDDPPPVDDPDELGNDEASVLILMADAAAHAPCLKSLQFVMAPLHTLAAMRAVADVALLRGMTAVSFCSCFSDLIEGDGVLAELARLVSDGGGLAELHLWGAYQLLRFDVTPLASALRCSTTLTSLTLGEMDLWDHIEAANALLGALLAHPTLHTLLIPEELQSWTQADFERRAAAASAAITPLIAANAPALREMNCTGLLLGHAGLRPLYEAVVFDNTHLRVLNTFICMTNADFDQEPMAHFLRFVVLPAARFCTSLRSLTSNCDEADELVMQRADDERAGMLPAPPVRLRTVLDRLPREAVIQIFAQLPVDCRLRCLEVCSSWYMMLGEHSLWKRIDLSLSSGIVAPRSNALLLAAAARANFEQKAVDLTGCSAITMPGFDAACCGPVTRCWLSELRLSSGFEVFEVDVDWNNDLTGLIDVFDGCLQLLEVDVKCRDAAQARRVLQNTCPFQAVRVRRLTVGAALDEDEDTYMLMSGMVDDEQHSGLAMRGSDVVSLAADVSAHEWLTELYLGFAPLSSATLAVLVDAVLLRRLSHLTLYWCTFPTKKAGGSAPLARLLAEGSLRELRIVGRGGRSMCQQDAEALGAALARARLQVLELSDVDFFHAQSPHAALLRGLVGHATLQQLLLPRNSVRDEAQRVAAGAELGALVAANAPALQQLDVADCYLQDAGLTPLLAALPANTHLRVLRGAGNACSATFARESLLPLVRANASLRELVAATHGDLRADDERSCALREAQALVRSRVQP